VTVQVSITCKHGNINDEVREYLTRKSEKLLTYFERVTAINVTVDFEQHKDSTRKVKVEILVDAEHKHNFVAADEGENVVHAFDLTLHKMEQQLKKYKEKVQDHRRTPPMNQVVDPNAR